MKTKEVIELMQKNDPTGEMQVWLAVDAGEGYVPLSMVYSDRLGKQPVDGDEVDGSQRAIALFLGDHNAEGSKVAKYGWQMDPESEKEFFDENSDDYGNECVIFDYNLIREIFENFLRLKTNIPTDYKIHVLLTDDEQDIVLSQTAKLSDFLPKLINTPEVLKELKNLFLTMQKIEGVDVFGRTISIVKM